MNPLGRSIGVGLIVAGGIVALVVVAMGFLQDPLAERTVKPPHTVLTGAFHIGEPDVDSRQSPVIPGGVVGRVSSFSIENTSGQASLIFELDSPTSTIRTSTDLGLGGGSCTVVDDGGREWLVHISQAEEQGPVSLRDIYNSREFTAIRP